MHRNNRKKFVYNYKHINIHKYKNCLYSSNYNKIYNYIIHYCKKHNIQIDNLKINLYRFEYNGDIETLIPTTISFKSKSNNKWVKRLKLICIENEIDLQIYE